MKKGEGLVSIPIVIDGIAIIVNKEAGVSTILDQIASIFTGDVDN